MYDALISEHELARCIAVEFAAAASEARSADKKLLNQQKINACMCVLRVTYTFLTRE